MSIKLMSAIFETEFRDLPIGETNTEGKERMAKASSAKIVMLSIADHANDEGEGSYPGLTRLELKTGLSRQGIIDVQKALKYNGLISVDEEPSKLGTNNYRINLSCFPRLQDTSQVTLLVKPLDYPSQATLPEVVKSLDLNHPLTTIKPNILDGEKILKKALPEWSVLAGQKIQEEQAEEAVDKYTEIWNATGAFERDMRFNPLPWNTNDDWTKFQTFVVEQYRKDPEIFFKYKSWQLNEGKYQALSNKQIKASPKNFIDCFPDFLAHSSINSKKETTSISRNLNG